MNNLYRARIYPVLSRVEPERAHNLALAALQTAERLPAGLHALRKLSGPADARLRVECCGLTFDNPLGVAAGLDKDARAVAALFALGFGAVEVGTVTPRPQPGNSPPRLWRFPEQEALVNALGFPSGGAAAVRKRLVGRQFVGVLGVNLGKNRDTPPDKAAEDYVAVLSVLWDVAGYITVNVSSPNTPGLRDLQQRSALIGILAALDEQNQRMARLHNRQARPILVKISPDLDEQALDEVLGAAVDGGADGLIIANTTTDRSGLAGQGRARDLPGGVSGQPLRARSTAMVRRAHQQLGGRLSIIGAGGIASAADVIERMRAGASLVQLYTSFIYGGPALPGHILHDLSHYLDREGLRSITDIIGVAENEPAGHVRPQ